MATFRSSKDWFNKRLKGPLDQLKASNLPLQIAANSTHVLMADRIFLKGENSKGDTFDYSEGYRRTKRKFGRAKGTETAFVNYTLTGVLKSDFTNGLKRKEAGVFQVEVKRSDSLNKIDNLEEKYGGVSGGLFVLSKQEREHFFNIVEKEFKRIMGV